jgi:hypothetical protein
MNSIISELKRLEEKADMALRVAIAANPVDGVLVERMNKTDHDLKRFLRNNFKTLIALAEAGEVLRMEADISEFCASLAPGDCDCRHCAILKQYDEMTKGI